MTDGHRHSDDAKDGKKKTIMTIDEAATYYNAVPARLCGRCRLVFHSVVNKRIHDKWRHNEKVEEEVEVEASETYCMDCNLNITPISAFCEHIVTMHQIRVKVVIRDPECQGCGREFASVHKGSE
jgi:hypothetical protein